MTITIPPRISDAEKYAPLAVIDDDKLAVAYLRACVAHAAAMHAIPLAHAVERERDRIARVPLSPTAQRAAQIVLDGKQWASVGSGQ